MTLNRLEVFLRTFVSSEKNLNDRTLRSRDRPGKVIILYTNLLFLFKSLFFRFHKKNLIKNNILIFQTLLHFSLHIVY